MAQTVRNIINRSLRKIGARAFSESVGSEEAFEALQDFNDLVAQMAIDNLWSYTISQSEQAIEVGKEVYTIGTITSDFPIARPHEFVSIEVQYNNTWRPLKFISRNDFVNAVKQDKDRTIAYPYYFTYFPDMPEARIEFYPAPALALPIRLNFRNLSTEYGLDDETGLPREYESYFVVALAAKLAMSYGTDPTIASGLGSEAKMIFKRITLQNYSPETMESYGRRVKYDAKSNTYI